MTEAEMQDKLLRMEERYKRTIIDLKAQIIDPALIVLNERQATPPRLA